LRLVYRCILSRLIVCEEQTGIETCNESYFIHQFHTVYVSGAEWLVDEKIAERDKGGHGDEEKLKYE